MPVLDLPQRIAVSVSTVVACASIAHAQPFTDVTVPSGVAAGQTSLLEFHITGQAWGDVDGDGCVDLYVTSSAGSNHSYQNDCQGAFIEAPWAAGAALLESASGGTAFGDYDNDGDLDLMVANLGANILLRNDAGAGWTDVSASAGIGHLGQGESVAWGDFDRDGWIDILVVNWFYQQMVDHPLNHDVLLRNQGNGTFEDMSQALDGPTARRPGFAGSFLDYDNDGDLDIYVVNDKTQGNALWRNDGAGCGGWCFTDVAVATGAVRPASAMGVAVGDVDNDGDLDLAYSGISEVILLESRVAQGEDRFIDVSETAGVVVADFTVAWGVNFLDYDNDGWLDLFVATVNAGATQTDRLFHNRGDGTFDDHSSTSGLSMPDESIGSAAADFDHDGRVDLVIGNRNDAYRLYRNTEAEASTRGWLAYTVEGRLPIDRGGLGTRVTLVDQAGGRQLREVRSGDSIGGGSERTIHFGLGRAEPSHLEIRWLDGTTEIRPVTRTGERRTLLYPMIFVDGFESGDLSTWSVVVTPGD